MKAHLLLRKAFERAQKVHPELTLRSLASRSNISAGFLSKVFSGQKDLNIKLAERLFKLLAMDSLQRDQVLSAMESSILKTKLRGARVSKPAKASTSSLDEFTLMDTDAEWLLGKWYRLTLLDLVTCSNFKESTKWIVSRLGVSQSEAESAMKELERYGYLQRDTKSVLRKTHENLRFPTKFSKDVIRNYQKSQMRRATAELDHKTSLSDFSRRLIASVSVASNPKSVERAKAILHEAMYEAAAVLAEGEATEVYQINLQFFPQTQDE
ncbi:MAG: TIGR02147 family protein [Proteobacteria bacterium]|nr:MAG: TIGR02147 family protein [Pseudomonadota bacterium]